MFRLQKNKPIKTGERVDVKFSDFKATQVPKGWDKLFVSVVSVKNAKTVSRSSKALVRNGACQWTDSFPESIWLLHDDHTKEMEDCLYKFVVASGLTKSNILGEAAINMTNCMATNSIIPLSLPLNKSNHGTVLHVNIQCLTPRTKPSDDVPKGTNKIYPDANKSNAGIISDKYDSTSPQSVGSSSSKDMDSVSPREEQDSRATSFSASGSFCSYDLAEGSLERESFNPGRKDSLNSLKSVSLSNNPEDESAQSNQSSSTSQVLRIPDSSKKFLDVAESTMEELRAEAKMWERNARKLMLDVDMLREEFFDQSKEMKKLGTDLSAAHTECDHLKTEVETLKMTCPSNTASDDSMIRDGGAQHIAMELKGELRFQKESNADLALQLKRSQESNIELVSILQELEETVEKQKKEIENLSALQLKVTDKEKSLQINTERNENSKIQVLQMEDSAKSLVDKVHELEQALEEKKQEIENLKSKNSLTLLDLESEYRSKLSSKEKEIVCLKEQVSKSLQERHPSVTERPSCSETDLVRETKLLKEKIKELEMDCNELTEENLELLIKLKEMNNNPRGTPDLVDTPEKGFGSQIFNSFVSKASKDNSEELQMDDTREDKLTGKIENCYTLSMQELENLKMALEDEVKNLTEEVSSKVNEIKNITFELSSKDKEIGFLMKHNRELETKVQTLESEKYQIEEKMELMIQESHAAYECYGDSQYESKVLSEFRDLERYRFELELHLSEREKENARLLKQLSDLEAELKYLRDESKLTQFELENSKSHIQSLEEEITALKTENEYETEAMQQKMKDAEFHLSKTQQESEYLRKENMQLINDAENLNEECSSLLVSNRELGEQKLELQRYCSQLEVRLKESEHNFAECSERFEMLEKNFSLTLQDISSKEKSLQSELDLLLVDHQQLRDKLMLTENLLRQKETEKVAEVENLQKEIEKLTLRVSETCNEKEIIISDADLKVSAICSEKAELESALQEVQSKVVLLENETNAIQVQYEKEVKKLKGELDCCKIDGENLLQMVEDYKLIEAELKDKVNGLALKLKVSESGRQRLIEESKTLKARVQDIDCFKDEILNLKNELTSTKSEREKLEASLSIMSKEAENLKTEKKLYVEKMSTLQNAVSDLDNCLRSKKMLEEKLLQFENDLMAKEAACSQHAELKIELDHINEMNMQYKETIKSLEGERVQCLKKVQALEEELEQTKEQKQNHMPKINRRVAVQENATLSKNHRVKNISPRHGNRRKPFFKNEGEGREVVESEVNNNSEVKLDRLSLNSHNQQAVNPLKSKNEGDVMPRENLERTKALLEAELKDLEERYLHMSLKYAEAEAHREELVMMLKMAMIEQR